MASVAIPIIRLYGCLIVSIQVDLTDSLVVALKNDIANAIDLTNPRALLIDISGMEVMDSYISRAIQELAEIASLMGARTIIAGMSPNVALTLTEMSIVHRGIVTALNLERGLEMVLLQEDSSGDE